MDKPAAAELVDELLALLLGLAHAIVGCERPRLDADAGRTIAFARRDELMARRGAPDAADAAVAADGLDAEVNDR